MHGDGSLKATLAALERDAGQALALPARSVMDKTITPPSGDKHDYMSQAPYWWPDPSKPDGRPYIRRDGERNPEINRIPDHDALGALTSAASTLGLAYFLTGREEYAIHAARCVRTWFLDPGSKMNPHLRYGQGIPGLNEGRGIGIIETRGLPAMLDGLALIRGSAAWTDKDDDGMHQWMRAYLDWLVTSAHGREEAENGNNHETWYNVQVAALALYTNQRKLAQRAVERGRQRLPLQIEPDGRQPRELERTRAWNYSVFNLEAYFALAMAGERAGVDLWNVRTRDGRSLRRALDFLVPYAAGERKWTYPEIGGFEPAALVPMLRRAAVVWNAPEYRALAARLGGSARLDLIVP